MALDLIEPTTDTPPLADHSEEAPGSRQVAFPPTALFRGRVSKLTLLSIVLIGTALRARGFTESGLWRDDAWVAMSGRVGIGTAWHMWVTAPGFYLFERSWMVLHPGSTLWAQIPPFLMGVACIPVIYAVARYFKLHDWIALVLALVVCVSPICNVYSTRLKEYQCDFLLACCLLVAAEASRRRPSRRTSLVLVLASVSSFAISASTLPVVVGIWTALVLQGLRPRRQVRRIFAAATCVGIGLLVVAAVLYSHLSPASGRGWHSFFITHSSLLGLLSSGHGLLLDLYVKMLGIAPSPFELACMFLVVSGLLFLGLAGGRATWASGLTLGAAIAACVLGTVPIGTGRTDEVLYPALLLLMGFGLQCLSRLATNWHPGRLWRRGLPYIAGTGLTVTLLFAGVGNSTAYPATDTAALASAINQHFQPGDHIVVGELMRYPWALYEDSSLRLRFGLDWSAGFTVTSTQPDVFIAPSEVYEAGSTPAKWAEQMGHYRRLWFVEALPLSLNPLYASLRADGWRPVNTLHKTGCAAILLTRA